MNLADFLVAAAHDGLIPWKAELAAARDFKASARDVEAMALRAGFLPERYARNFGTIGLEGQVALHAARVAVAGCGGLGGYLIEILARIGVGTIIAIDPDTFDESNLNRQILATVETLGMAKADVAVERMRSVNPAVDAIAVRAKLDEGNAGTILKGVHVVADGLDTIPSRLHVADACLESGIPFVHAGVAGFGLQVVTQGKGSRSLRDIYGSTHVVRGIETERGNLPFTVANAASIEAAEVCKLILGLSGTLCDRILFFDMLAMEFHPFPL